MHQLEPDLLLSFLIIFMFDTLCTMYIWLQCQPKQQYGIVMIMHNVILKVFIDRYKINNNITKCLLNLELP